MKFLTEIADKTNIPVTLQVAVVSSGGFIQRSHPVVALGETKKNKIPVQSLPKWYEKFGFTKSPSYTAKKKDMNYQPKQK